MPAEIDSMMYAGETPWHRLGTRLDNPATAEEAIVAAGLDWETQLQPIYTGPDRSIKVKDRYVVCRTDRLDQKDGGQLGIVSGTYHTLSNRDALGSLTPWSVKARRSTTRQDHCVGDDGCGCWPNCLGISASWAMTWWKNMYCFRPRTMARHP